MNKDPDIRKPVKVSPALWLRLKGEQAKLLQQTGEAPTQGDLLARAWDVYKATTRPKIPVFGREPASAVVVPAAKLAATPEDLALAMELLLAVWRRGGQEWDVVLQMLADT